MKRCVVLLAAAVLLGADKPADDAAKDEVKKLQGTWKVTGAVVGGRDLLVGKGTAFEEIVVEGEKMTIKGRGKTQLDARIKPDPSKSPKAMDWVNEKKETLPTIYSVEKDELKLAFPAVPASTKPPIKRPEGFDTKDKPVAVLTAKRQKP